jgi:hypothetical protein
MFIHRNRTELVVRKIVFSPAGASGPGRTRFDKQFEAKAVEMAFLPAAPLPITHSFNVVIQANAVNALKRRFLA